MGVNVLVYSHMISGNKNELKKFFLKKKFFLNLFLTLILLVRLWLPEVLCLVLSSRALKNSKVLSLITNNPPLSTALIHSEV